MTAGATAAAPPDRPGCMSFQTLATDLRIRSPLATLPINVLLDAYNDVAPELCRLARAFAESGERSAAAISSSVRV